MRKEYRRFLRDTEVNRFGGYIKIFYLGKQANGRKTKTGRYPRWAQPTWARLAPGKPGAPWCLVPTRVIFMVVSYFPNFLNIPELTKNIFTDFSEYVYLPYHVPPLFHDSRVLWKVSFMCSSGVIVCIILLSTFMGVPEI